MGLSSALKASVLGMKGISERFKAHSQNISAAGVISAKKRTSFLFSMNNASSTSRTTFTPGGIQSVQKMYVSEPGSQLPSPIPTHMALGRNAFFVVNNTADDLNPGKFAFTRVGTFEKDKNGNFVNHVGQFLKYFPTDSNKVPLNPDVSTFTQIKTLNVKNLTGTPTPTANVKLALSLPGNAPITPGTGSTQTTPITVYDALGTTHTLTLNWVKTAQVPGTSQTWRLTVSGGADVTAVGAPYNAGLDVVFDGTGKIATIGGVAGPPPALTVDWNSGAAQSNINMNLGAIGGTDGVVSVGNKLVKKPFDIDGMAPGEYSSLAFDEDGYVTVSFTNGESRIIGRVPVATFANEDGLIEGSGNVYDPSEVSGNYVLHFPKEGGAGNIIAGAVEESTIDTGDVFTDMIVDQKRYTANLKTISTIERMLDALEKIIG